MFKKENFASIVWVLGASFCLHLIYLFQLAQTPYFNVPLVDASWYYKESIKILNGGWLGDSVFFMAPLYQYFLAVIFHFFGINICIVLIIQSILSVTSIWLISLAAKYLFGPQTGLLAGVIACLHGVFIFYSGLLLKANLSIFFVCLFLVLFLKTCKRPVANNFFWCGLILGILVPIRGNFLIVFFGFLLWFIFFPLNKNFRLKNTIAYCLGAILIIAPITIRNYYVSGDFVLVNSAGGFNFFIGNNPIADGYNIAPSYIRLTPFYEENDSQKRAEMMVGRKLRASEVSSYWFEEGLKFIKEKPIGFIILQFKKIIIFFNNNEKSDNYDFSFMKTFTPILYLGFIPFGWIFILALTGIYWGRWRSPSFVGIYLLILTYALSVIIFFVKSRYRVPIVPPMIPLAAYAIHNALKKVLEMKMAMLFPFIFTFIFIGSIVFRPIQNETRSAQLNNYGVALETIGRLDESIKFYKRALETHPIHRRAALNLSLAYHQKKLQKEAIFFVKKSLIIDSKFTEARMFLASLLLERDQINDSIEEYKTVLIDEPGNVKAHTLLGNIYLLKKQFDFAENHFNLAFRFSSNPAQTLNNIGVLYMKQRQLDMAKKKFLETLANNPKFAMAYYNLGMIYKVEGNANKARDLLKIAKQLDPHLKDYP